MTRLMLLLGGALAAGLALIPSPAPAADTALRVLPSDSLQAVSARLASDPFVTEVVLAGGVYRQSLDVPPLRVASGTAPPLLIRPAEGESVVFDGARPVPRARPVKGRAGVFWVAQWSTGNEPPRIWETQMRVRYGLAADLDAVTRFPGTYVLDDGKVYFHTSDGRAPGDGSIQAGALDQGILVRRPNVTVRDLEFRNFVARGKWSAGVQVEGDQVTVERCSVSNASFGFTLGGTKNALVECTTRDVGGGVYLAGRDGRVQGCRFLKTRDAFRVTPNPQDDTGIQFYFPAAGGVVERNLVVGFHVGILVKAEAAPWRIEHNTLVGAGPEAGFIATAWPADATFRRNVIAGFPSAIQIHDARADRRGIEGNCTAGAAGSQGDVAGREPVMTVAEARFVDPALDDYRLEANSPCVPAAQGEAMGALPVIDAEAERTRPPRVFYVSPAGRDGAPGTEAAPVRTVQFAVDRVRPGDTVILGPGIYAEPVTIRRGGVKGAPIVLRAAKRGTAILDANRKTETMISIEDAPWVIVRDLEIRWFTRIGIAIKRSPAVTVTGCRIWNAGWDGVWPNGTGVQVDESPSFTGDRNELFAQDMGFFLLNSPGSTITHNTAVANLLEAAYFVYSIEGSVCRDNSFAFEGNDALAIVEAEGGRRRLESFDCDYNNYAMPIRNQEPGVVYDRVVPRDVDRHLAVPSKGIVTFMEGTGALQRFLTMSDWRAFSGRDAHSIFADPLYVATAARDFRLQPDSPNIGAGSGGGTIGAHDGSGD